MLFDWIGQRFFRLVHERSLVYAACWEDPEVDRAALGIGKDDTVLVITSAGCNALDYLLEGPQQVFAVDVNWRQNALLELKRAAAETLPWEDSFALFGGGRHPQARQLYHAALRPRLGPRERGYWDQQIRLFCGSQSFYFRTPSGWAAAALRSYVERGLGLWPAFEKLLAAQSIDEQRAIYDDQIRPHFWRPLLGMILSQDAVLALSGIPPQQRRQLLQATPNLLGYLQQRAENLIYHTLLRENYFWRLYLTGEFTPECCPRYLEQQRYPQLRELLPRLASHTATVAEFLQSSRTPISRYVLLDHMDWLAEGDGLAREWQSIVDRAAPGAKVLWRSLGTRADFVNDVPVHVAGRQTTVRELLDYDTALAEQLRARERTSVYGALAIATLRIPANGASR